MIEIRYGLSINENNIDGIEQATRQNEDGRNYAATVFHMAGGREFVIEREEYQKVKHHFEPLTQAEQWAKWDAEEKGQETDIEFKPNLTIELAEKLETLVQTWNAYHGREGRDQGSLLYNAMRIARDSLYVEVLKTQTLPTTLEPKEATPLLLPENVTKAWRAFDDASWEYEMNDDVEMLKKFNDTRGMFLTHFGDFVNDMRRKNAPADPIDPTNSAF